MMDDRTEKPVVCPRRGARAQQFVIGDDETEPELSLGSRSFLNRVNDQVRKRQERSSMNVTQDSEKLSVIWSMFMSSTLESAVFMGKNYLDKCHSVTNTKDLTVKQMFDISAKLVSEQDEIYGVKRINWLGKSIMEVFIFGWWWTSHQSSTHKSLHIFRFCIVSWKDTREPSINHSMGTKIRVVQKFTGIQNFGQNWTVSRWNSSGIFSQDWIRCSSVKKFKSTVEIEWNTRDSYRKDHLHVDV